jgi:DNA-binding Lrp family transcriptional regulator
LKETQLKVLKIMHEATGRMDINVFSQAVGLTPEQAIEQIHQLANMGFLKKVGSGYCLTDKGKNALLIGLQAPANKAFNFYVGLDKPIGFSARSIDEFYRAIKQVPSDVLDFHLYRGDFERWVEEVVQDKELASEIDELEGHGLNGEELRKALLKVIDSRYGVNELL